MTVELDRRRRVHVVGVGGAGMSAIAEVLVAMGHEVSGSDQRDSAVLRRLSVLGVRTAVGHDGANLGDADLVAVSTAVPATNPEVAAARVAGVEVVTRAEVLAAICAARRTLAVSGTHGKTTTSSMLALITLEAGVHPGFIVGGDLHEIGSGARWDDAGELFVVEADESDGTFLALPAAGVLVTNVEADHLDHYGDLAAIEAAFARFLAQAPGPNVACADDPGAARLGRQAGALLYGTDGAADYRVVDPETGRGGSSFRLFGPDGELGELRLPLPGLHNVRNAAGAVALALEHGIPFEACRAALARYAGVARRFQVKGEERGVTVVDDYAHNPGKVAAVLAAARAGGWRRVVAVFQPHRFTRTAALLDAFGSAFADADVLVVMEVYAAGEPPIPGISGRSVVEAVLAAHPWARVAWLPGPDDVLGFLRAELRPGDLCLTVGAGDVTDLGDRILDVLR